MMVCRTLICDVMFVRMSLPSVNSAVHALLSDCLLSHDHFRTRTFVQVKFLIGELVDPSKRKIKIR